MQIKQRSLTSSQVTASFYQQKQNTNFEKIYSRSNTIGKLVQILTQANAFGHLWENRSVYMHCVHSKFLIEYHNYCLQ